MVSSHFSSGLVFLSKPKTQSTAGTESLILKMKWFALVVCVCVFYLLLTPATDVYNVDVSSCAHDFERH